MTLKHHQKLYTFAIIFMAVLFLWSTPSFARGDRDPAKDTVAGGYTPAATTTTSTSVVPTPAAPGKGPGERLGGASHAEDILSRRQAAQKEAVKKIEEFNKKGNDAAKELYCSLNGIVTGNIGTLLGLALSLYGLYLLMVSGAGFAGLVVLLSGVAFTAMPGLIMSFVNGMYTVYSKMAHGSANTIGKNACSNSKTTSSNSFRSAQDIGVGGNLSSTPSTNGSFRDAQDEGMYEDPNESSGSFREAQDEGIENEEDSNIESIGGAGLLESHYGGLNLESSNSGLIRLPGATGGSALNADTTTAPSQNPEIITTTATSKPIQVDDFAGFVSYPNNGTVIKGQNGSVLFIPDTTAANTESSFTYVDSAGNEHTVNTKVVPSYAQGPVSLGAEDESGGFQQASGTYNDRFFPGSDAPATKEDVDNLLREYAEQGRLNAETEAKARAEAEAKGIDYDQMMADRENGDLVRTLGSALADTLASAVPGGMLVENSLGVAGSYAADKVADSIDGGAGDFVEVPATAEEALDSITLGGALKGAAGLAGGPVGPAVGLVLDVGGKIAEADIKEMQGIAYDMQQNPADYSYRVDGCSVRIQHKGSTVGMPLNLSNCRLDRD